MVNKKKKKKSVSLTIIRPNKFVLQTWLLLQAFARGWGVGVGVCVCVWVGGGVDISLLKTGENIKSTFTDEQICGLHQRSPRQ